MERTIKTKKGFAKQLKADKWHKLSAKTIEDITTELMRNQAKWNTYHKNAHRVDILHMNGFHRDILGTFQAEYVIVGLQGAKHIKILAYDTSDFNIYILDPMVWGMRFFM